jgi:hypothetical protein
MSNIPSNAVPDLPAKEVEKIDGPAEFRNAAGSVPNAAAACRTVETQAATVIQVRIGSRDLWTGCRS